VIACASHGSSKNDATILTPNIITQQSSAQAEAIDLIGNPIPCNSIRRPGDASSWCVSKRDFNTEQNKQLTFL